MIRNPVVAPCVCILRFNYQSRRPLRLQAAFPFQTRGRIMAPVLLVQLTAPSEPAALHAVVMAFDGYLYMIDGASGANRPISPTDVECILTTMQGCSHCLSLVDVFS